MRVETVVVFRLTVDEAERLNPLLPAAMPNVSFREGSWQVRFHHAPEAVRDFARSLVGADVGFDVREERSFTAEELERAPAVRLHAAPVVAVSREGFSGPCGHGPRAVDDLAPMRLAAEADFRVARTDGGELLVHERVAGALIREHVEGCLLRPVADLHGAPSPFFEVVPVHRLPPMHSPPTRFARRPDDVCPGCGRGGLLLASPPFYDVDLRALADVNATYETFGTGEVAAPDLLFSAKLWRVLREEGAVDLEVEPVLFV